MLSLTDFKRIIDPMKDSLLGVSLSVRGEPLMNPEIIEMVRYCHENNIGTSFPSNFSLKLDRDRIESLVTSGLDHIMVAVDGITQEIYGKYRVGGQLSLVMDNIANLVDAKKRLGSKTPLVEFKYILFDHNKHQAADAEKFANDLGCDRFSQVMANEAAERMEEFDLIRKANRNGGKACYWPWNNAVIFYDGTVSACCMREIEMGNILEEGFAIWNNENYRSIRRFFNSKLISNEDRGRWFCEKCMIF